MDDFSITDARLRRALENLRASNRWLGGQAAIRAALKPLVFPGAHLRVLDVGTGAADLPEYLVRWAADQGARLDVVAVDANPATVAYARQVLDRRLPGALRDRIRVEEEDALDVPHEDGTFDVAMASLFMHHFDEADAIRLLREMRRVSRRGLVVSDLHRHPLAYYGLTALTALLPVSPMFRHDGPLSVLRGFTRSELHALAQSAGLREADLRWCWLFRWVLSTVA